MASTNGMRRRAFLKTMAAGGLSALAADALAQAVDFKPSTRYPDIAVEILDPSFAKYRRYSSSVEQLGAGMRWAEGPAYFPASRYGLVSDICKSDGSIRFSDRRSASAAAGKATRPCPSCRMPCTASRPTAGCA